MTHRQTRDDAIVDPRAFLSTASPASPLWALVDSFDAATNGMTNPEAAARLSETDEEAFRPWKALVSALRSFYADDAGGLSDALDRIPDSAPPAVLKPLFRAWAAEPDASAAELLAEAPAAVAGLYRRVVTDSHPVEGLAEQAEEALRQGMVEHFEALACRVLRELHETTRSDGPLLALRYAARCLELLAGEGEEDTAFFSALIRTLGRADGLTALGLALVGQEDKAAAAAFRGALTYGGPSAFLDAETRTVLAAAVEILESSGPKAEKRRRAAREAPGQLPLFSAEAV